MIRLLRFSPSGLALGYVALSIVALSLFAVQLWYAWSVNISTFRAYVEDKDLQLLVDSFDKEGAKGLVATIDSQLKDLEDDHVRVLADSSKRRLAGNLPAWPAQVPDASGTYGLVIDVGDGATMRVVASHIRLPGGYHLLIGRESARFQSLVERFWYGIAAAIAIVLVLGAAVGSLIHRALLTEVHEISRTASAIAEGDTSRRLAMRSGSPELDSLAHTVNAMLARLAQQNVQLEGEIAVRRQAEQALHRTHDQLEGTVAQRTAQLAGANESFRLSEERYARAMEGSEEGHWEWNLANDEMFLSDRMKEILGIAPGEHFTSRADFFDRQPIHPNDRQGVASAREAVLSGASSRYDVEYRVVRSQGDVRWVRSRGKLFLDERGIPARMSGSLSDVSDRKLAEVAVRRSEERFALAVAGSNDGLWDWDILTDQMFFSERAQRLYGLEPGSAVRPRAEWRAMIALHPDDVEGQKCAVDDYLARRTPSYDGEWRVRHADGVYRWIRIRGTCVRDDTGRATRLAGSISDIDQQKCAEAALRLAEERYALAMAASEEGYWDWIVATDEFYASPRMLEIYGFPPNTSFADRADFLARFPFHPEDRPKWERAIAAHFAGDTVRFDIEMRMLPRGETRWIHLTGLCSRDASGAPVRWTGAVIDITAGKHAQEALRESEERFALAVAGSNEGIFDWDLATDHVFLSHRAQELSGLEPVETWRPRDEWAKIFRFHPDDLDRQRNGIRAHLAGETPTYDVEYRLILPEGYSRWFRQRGLALRNAAGKAYRMAGSIEDITDRKLAADALRESEARFRTLTNLSSDWYWEQDEDMRFTYMSNEVLALAGYSAESSLGKARWDLESIRPLSCSWPEHQAVLEARESFRDFEYCRQGLDGSNRYISVSGAPIFDEHGRFRGYHGVARNITERKRIEEELRARQEMLDLAQKAARAVAFEWRIGAGEGENRWSPDLEVMCGLAPGSYDGTYDTWKKLVFAEDWPAVSAAIRHAGETGDVAAEYRVVHPDGTVHWLQAKGRMIFDPENRPLRLVGFMLDVTERYQADEERRRLERQLRQAQRLEAMGTLAGGIAHDFNNILSAILGYGEMALRDVPNGTRLRRDLDSILTAGERGRALVERILAFSRSGVAERVAVHVEDVAREALNHLAARLPSGVSIEPRLRSGRAAVLGDPTQVHQVLMNLATNAIQAMPSGGKLRVSLEPVRLEASRVATTAAVPAGDYLVLEVADEGIGIPSDVMERIFDPFFTTKEVGVGTGLGLSLVHGIVTELGGAIDVASTPGAGSTFTVYLPHVGNAADDRARDELDAPRGDRQLVLVVDDEESLVRLVTETLADLGYKTIGFTSSAAALNAFRAHPDQFDAVITDERMPGMSGSTLIREMRVIRRAIPILLVTGDVSAAVVQRAREAGADDVLRKPLSAHALATGLSRALR